LKNLFFFFCVFHLIEIYQKKQCQTRQFIQVIVIGVTYNIFIKKRDSPYSLEVRTERDSPNTRGVPLRNVPIFFTDIYFMLLNQLKKSLPAEADFFGGSGSIEIPTGQSLMEKPLLEFGSCPEKIIGRI